jgi:poly(3-hydroxybutyrate) depolymerase
MQTAARIGVRDRNRHRLRLGKLRRFHVLHHEFVRLGAHLRRSCRHVHASGSKPPAEVALAVARPWDRLASMRLSMLLVCAMVGCSSSSEEVPTEPNDDSATVDSEGFETQISSDATSDSIDLPPMDTGGAVEASADTGPLGTFGCTEPPLAPGVTDQKINVEGTDRTYVLSIPTGYDGKTPLPLAFGWHGRTGNGKLFRTYSGVEVAAKGKAIFVYPDGLTVTPSNPADTGWDLTSKGRDIKLYDSLVVDLSGKLCVDLKRVWSFGHSYGGYMSNFLGCLRGGTTLHGIGAWAGGLAGTVSCGKTPAWIGHAEDDPTVAFSEGQKARDFWSKSDGCAMTTTPTDPSPCVAYDGCGANPVTWCDSKTGGHNWPSYAGAGIWTFFSKL